jgi:hypothetical protein
MSSRNGNMRWNINHCAVHSFPSSSSVSLSTLSFQFAFISRLNDVARWVGMFFHMCFLLFWLECGWSYPLKCGNGRQTFLLFNSWVSERERECLIFYSMRDKNCKIISWCHLLKRDEGKLFNPNLFTSAHCTRKKFQLFRNDLQQSFSKNSSPTKCSALFFFSWHMTHITVI